MSSVESKDLKSMGGFNREEKYISGVNVEKEMFDSQTIESFEEGKLIAESSNFYEKVHRDYSNQSFIMIRRIYNGWIKKENKESEERNFLTKILISVLLAQIILNFGLIVAIGKEALKFDSTIIITYFTAFVAELIGIVVIMMTYLYNERSTTPLEVIKDVLINVGSSNVQLKGRDQSR